MQFYDGRGHEVEEQPREQDGEVPLQTNSKRKEGKGITCKSKDNNLFIGEKIKIDTLIEAYQQTLVGHAKWKYFTTLEISD